MLFLVDAHHFALHPPHPNPNTQINSPRLADINNLPPYAKVVESWQRQRDYIKWAIEVRMTNSHDAAVNISQDYISNHHHHPTTIQPPSNHHPTTIQPLSDHRQELPVDHPTRLAFAADKADRAGHHGPPSPSPSSATRAGGAAAARAVPLPKRESPDERAERAAAEAGEGAAGRAWGLPAWLRVPQWLLANTREQLLRLGRKAVAGAAARGGKARGGAVRGGRVKEDAPPLVFTSQAWTFEVDPWDGESWLESALDWMGLSSCS